MMTRMPALTVAVLTALSAVPAGAQMRDRGALFSPGAVEAAQLDPRAFTVDETTIKVEPVEIEEEAGRGEEPRNAAPADQSKVDIEKIVNIAEKVFDIVAKNKPVVNIKTQYACGVPKGIDHWTQLEGWKPPVGAAYRLTAKNLYGMKVVDVKYRVLRTYGGNYKGQGAYLTGVTVESLFVDVSWGYSVDLTAEVPDSSVVNVGSSEAPVAGMMPTLTWRIRTVLKDVTGKELYFLQGDGLFKEVGGKFRSGMNDKAAKAFERASGAMFD